MYLPSAFAETDLAVLDALVARDSFITLITYYDENPFVSHLPALYRRNESTVELRGHWARANPQAAHSGGALAIIHGPHAYISPSWYLDKEEESRVPTWNYAVAHLRGRLEISSEPEFLSSIVGELSAQHEAAVGSDWRFEREREGHTRQLKGIVGFRFTVSEAAIKVKLNQNHPRANREAVAAHLGAQQREDSREIAMMMRARERAE